jgi:3-oxoacyl-[acyl-carrier-protein] synthase III
VGLPHVHKSKKGRRHFKGTIKGTSYLAIKAAEDHSLNQDRSTYRRLVMYSHNSQQTFPAPAAYVATEMEQQMHSYDLMAACSGFLWNE